MKMMSEHINGALDDMQKMSARQESLQKQKDKK
jgi:hypothetical protein